MLKNLVLVTVLSVLCGCGGGDSGGDNSGGGTGTSPNDPLQQYLNIANQYTGIKTAASLDAVAASRFMQALASLQSEILPSYNDEQAKSTELCPNGGSAVLTPKPGDTEFDIKFSSCAEGGAILHGEATFRVTRRDAVGNVIEGLTIYRDTSLRYNSSQYVLRGNIRHKDLSTSCPTEQNISNLLLTEQGSGVQWYFENFRDLRFGTFGIGCMQEGIQFDGKVFISELGFVTVTTPELLMLPSMVTGSNYQGRLVLAGANAQVFNWRIRNSRTRYETLFTHDFSLSGDSGFSYQYRFGMLTDAMMLDFRDTDADGMPDSWERFYGLDPQNAADASLDLDGDGYSNLDEFAYLGDPADVAIWPSVYQLAVSLRYEEARHSEPVIVYTDFTHTSGAPAYNSELRYQTTSPFMFSESEYNCQVSANRLEASCKIDKIELNSHYQHSIRLEAPATMLNEISAPLTVSLYTSGRNTSTQTEDSITVVRQAADFGFEIYQPYPGTGNLLTVVGEQSSILLRLSQQGVMKDFVPGMKINVTMPQQLGDSSALCRQYDEWQPCTDYTIVHSSTTTEISVVFSANYSGIGMGTIEVIAPDNTDPVANWSFPVIVGLPSSVLQQQIDASADTVISVPAGVYVGGLNLADKYSVLEGDNQQTYLIGKIDANDYSLKQLKLDNGSEIKGFALAGLDITTGSSGAVFTSNRMALPELLLSGNQITANGDIALRKNRFSTAKVQPAFVLASNPISCTSLHFVQNNAVTPYQFIYQNNLFNNASVERGYCAPIHLAGGYNSTIEHNTVSDIYSFIEARADNETQIYVLKVENNIFRNISIAVSLNIDSSYFTRSPHLDISINNNLFDNVEIPLRNANMPHSFTDSIYQPAELNSLGEPLASSAAVDAAVNSQLTDDVFNQPRPIDGNGNGEDIADLGAVERQN